ncbi:gamma-glutamylcyclotransferase 2-3 isoform X2 [Hevea brasiliensis]|uniref:gamma-glutamylcyclotransferase 2-3 isoform X2 n=1 Tax=Hevea brasiliensis TaxID=3981 RepID=UPI0025DCE540|nr:gamma-glutamylcyclotransferase 2-3 isoform X2 [Hevea brasiliensis]
MWVFGYGSLIWKAGFNYDDRLVGFIKGYRRVFYQGSTDHRGTPEYPGRTVTLEPADGEVCWGVAYKISNKEDEETAINYLEVREKQYDQKAYLDLFTEAAATTPAVSGVMVYIGSPDKKHNQNYLGPAPLEEIAKPWHWHGSYAKSFPILCADKLYMLKALQDPIETIFSNLKKPFFKLVVRTNI